MPLLLYREHLERDKTMIQMKLDAAASLYSKSDVQVNVPAKEAAELNKTKSINSQVAALNNEAKAHNNVDVNMDEQNLISNLQTELNQLPDVDFDRVNLIKQQIQNGEINFDMGELAKTLANQN